MDVTIKDVAREANVAPSTVSRVLKDSPHISLQTKRRVREIMNLMGYTPNFQAQSLAGKSTQAIGVIMPDTAYQAFKNPFFSVVLRGISRSANEQKYGLYLSTSFTQEGIYEEVVSMVQGKRVDGLILLYSRKNDEVIEFLKQVNFPFIVIGRPLMHEKSITYVDNDNVTVAKDVTKYLIEMGHKNIAFIGGNENFAVTIDRLKGYREALEESGLPFCRDYLIDEHQFNDKGFESLKNLINYNPMPTAIIAQDDLTGYEILSYLEKLNIHVPRDLSIIGFNNQILSQHSRPPLTSIEIHISRLGIEATKSLIEKIKDPNTFPKRVTVPTQFIERESCRNIK
ncbi:MULTISPECIES: LacI family DNA-binding transcriptional regulator [unclassified Bacillus (in: firmicutes)]|uniref:LacI family DNA-binding transcriptional regulator n=1 Tax=unclassified Bacillus (in: firmicutes) TaxID=185979 RepID=UPI00080AE17C|nr:MULTISPECIES: LacI family DNA-binding transcriptional regulator [unclassified Bacillus (in: firmicutes)]OCA86272.1 LacI family transcriptional regulator [Bacillus sp. FJAT-27986]